MYIPQFAAADYRRPPYIIGRGLAIIILANGRGRTGLMLLAAWLQNNHSQNRNTIFRRNIG
jgi:hypothetical protein